MKMNIFVWEIQTDYLCNEKEMYEKINRKEYCWNSINLTWKFKLYSPIIIW